MVTRAVKVKGTDLEHRLMVRDNSHILTDNNTQFVSFFVHMRKSRDRFRINYPSEKISIV